MPTEDNRKDIQAEPSGEAVGTPPAPTNPNPKPNESSTEKLEKEIKHGEWWLIGIGVATLLINTIIALIYWGQLRQMTTATIEATKATKSAEWSAYWTCLSSQAAQNVFLQSLASNNDSHAMAIAATQQAAAEMQSERSSIWFLPRPPEPGEVNGPELGIVFTIKNEGKGDAHNVVIKHKAVLLRKSDQLRLSENKNDPQITLVHFPAGYVFPEKAEPPHGQLSMIDTVRDVQGTDVAAASDDAREFINGGPTMVAVFGTMTYSDIAGPHVERFCNIVWLMQAGTQRNNGSTENQSRCAKYNHRDTGYSYTPLAQPVSHPDTAASDVLCVKPKE
jgi:hypothetical protein